MSTEVGDFSEFAPGNADLWAVGCTLAGLLNVKPLFSGRHYGHQLDLTLDVVGATTLDGFYGIISRRSCNSEFRPASPCTITVQKEGPIQGTVERYADRRWL
jgi:hypothetical protein